MAVFLQCWMEADYNKQKQFGIKIKNIFPKKLNSKSFLYKTKLGFYVNKFFFKYSKVEKLKSILKTEYVSFLNMSSCFKSIIKSILSLLEKI